MKSEAGGSPHSTVTGLRRRARLAWQALYGTVRTHTATNGSLCPYDAWLVRFSFLVFRKRMLTWSCCQSA